jgi:hypothetical protein
MLAVYTGSTANLAVQSGDAISLSFPPTEIHRGNVCAQLAFTGLNDTTYELKESGTSVNTGGCDSSSLIGNLTAAMAKKAKPMPDEMGGEVVTPGTYKAASINIFDGANVTLRGGPSDIFLFQSGSTMVTGVDTKFILQNAAGGDVDVVQAKNILFALNYDATTGESSSLSGSILSGAAVTLGAGSDVKGFVLATGAMTFGEECSVNSASIGPSVGEIEANPAFASPITTLIDNALCFNEGAFEKCTR